MSSALKNLSAYDEQSIPSAEAFSFGIVVAEWHDNITHKLYEGCFDTLVKHGAKEESIHVAQVPGSFELPTGARLLATQHKLDAVICIGCVIQGETKHNEYINNAVATALTTMSVTSGLPCVYGVLTPNTEQQALDRAGGIHGNKGVEAAVTALRMAALKKQLSKQRQSIGYGR